MNIFKARKLTLSSRLLNRWGFQGYLYESVMPSSDGGSLEIMSSDQFNSVKERIFVTSSKLWFLYLCSPMSWFLIFQTMNSDRPKKPKLESGFKEIGILKFELVAKTQFLWTKNSVGKIFFILIWDCITVLERKKDANYP